MQIHIKYIYWHQFYELGTWTVWYQFLDIATWICTVINSLRSTSDLRSSSLWDVWQLMCRGLPYTLQVPSGTLSQGWSPLFWIAFQVQVGTWTCISHDTHNDYKFKFQLELENQSKLRWVQSSTILVTHQSSYSVTLAHQDLQAWAQALYDRPFSSSSKLLVSAYSCPQWSVRMNLSACLFLIGYNLEAHYHP